MMLHLVESFGQFLNDTFVECVRRMRFVGKIPNKQGKADANDETGREDKQKGHGTESSMNWI